MTDDDTIEDIEMRDRQWHPSPGGVSNASRAAHDRRALLRIVRRLERDMNTASARAVRADGRAQRAEHNERLRLEQIRRAEAEVDRLTREVRARAHGGADET